MVEHKNVSFNELVSYLQKNPNRGLKLDPIAVQTTKPSLETPLDKLGLTGYSAHTLTPSGVLGMLAFIHDPCRYTIAPKSERMALVTEITTDLQLKADNLKNTALARKRKKIYDLIGAAYNNTFISDEDLIELYRGITFLKDVQMILIKSVVQEGVESVKQITVETSAHKGEILFSSNPINWSKNKPVWIADYRARWIAAPDASNAKNIIDFMNPWLCNCEGNGWLIEWPDVDGTKTEIIEQLRMLPTWTPSDASHRKEILARRLGRAKVIELFCRWNSKIDCNSDLEY